MRTLRVVIDAQIPLGGEVGGVEQFVVSLIRGLERHAPESIELVAVAAIGSASLLEARLGGRAAVTEGFLAYGPRHPGLVRRLGRFAPPLRRIARALGLAGRSPGPPAGVMESFYRNLGADVLHVPHQRHLKADVPVVFHPHDLQHVHFPEFFSAADRTLREATIREACRDARLVVTLSEFARADVIGHFSLDPAKVRSVLHWPRHETRHTPDATMIARAEARFGLPSRFALYPAQSWPHKNHLRLLRALVQAHARGSRGLGLVLCGRQNSHWASIENEIRTLGLGDAVRALGYVDDDELACLYRRARFVVFPSLFEGGGLPILESMAADCPVACAAVASLPEYAGGAALLFDPRDDASIAEALVRLDGEADLRKELVERGRTRLAETSEARGAERFVNFYREAASRALE